MTSTEKFMNEALKQARIAFEHDEIPIGAVVVQAGTIIGRGYNQRETTQTVHSHAEIQAMNEAAQFLGSWNLTGCDLYSTIEPCPMCAGAAIQARIQTIVYGAKEPNSGSLGTVVSLQNIKGFNHQIKVVSGVFETEASQLLVSYFNQKRRKQIKVRRVSEKDFESYRRLRIDVFVDEQNVPIELEMDEYDDLARNDVVALAAYCDQELIGTARYVIKEAQYKIGRVAVKKEYRGQGVGSKLLQTIEIQAENNGILSMHLGSQLSAQAFYNHLGYEAYGPIFEDAGIEHVLMQKTIQKK